MEVYLYYYGVLILLILISLQRLMSTVISLLYTIRNDIIFIPCMLLVRLASRLPPPPHTPPPPP